MTPQGERDVARRMVVRAQSEHGWTNAEVARRAGVDPATVGDFVTGRRWPNQSTLRRIDTALGWDPGTLAHVAMGLGQPPDPGTPSADTWVVDLAEVDDAALTALDRRVIEYAAFIAAVDKRRDLWRHPVGTPPPSPATGMVGP